MKLRTSLFAAILAAAAHPAIVHAGFQDCTASQQANVTNAIDRARVLADSALDNLQNTPLPNPLYSEWFGSSTPALHQRVVNNFSLLRSHLLIGVITAHCKCPAQLEIDAPGILATVHDPDYGINEAPYEVYLCNGFFALDQGAQFDSPAGVVLHEMSHFDIVNGTSDFCSGMADCRAKAQTDADAATRSSDSYEYFAESLN